MIIDENQLSTAHNILSTSKLKTQKQKQHPPHNNRPKQLLLKASSYLSIGQYTSRKNIDVTGVSVFYVWLSLIQDVIVCGNSYLPLVKFLRKKFHLVHSETCY